VHHYVDVLDELPGFLKSLGRKYDVTIHDYTAICPRINLFRNPGVYCGEPEAGECQRCLAEGGQRLAEEIVGWRAKGIWLIQNAQRVICPSEDVAKRIDRYVPGARLVVAPHEPELYRGPRSVSPPAVLPSEPLRVAILGSLPEHKGGKFLVECARAAKQAKVPIIWQVIGELSSFPRLVNAAVAVGIIETGKYKNDEIQDLIRRADPHILFFPQRWPETYSYTLSEAFASNRPILAPRIGSFAERISGASWCWSYPLDMKAGNLVDLLRFIRDHHLSIGVPPAPPEEDRTRSFSVDLDFYDARYLRMSSPPQDVDSAARRSRYLP
jgi:glycosyltransferase involved in cell wall biosynthesis